MKSRWHHIFYSFPVQLVIFHIRSNQLLLGMWIFLAFVISGDIAAKFGLQYLFLDPEYLGHIGFWSFFFLGLAFGCFYLTWNLTTYLISAHHFPFLASLSHPFTKFCLNNIVLPLGFFIFYLFMILHFQQRFSSFTTGELAWQCFGFLSGTLVLILIYFGYFRLTNRDISYYLRMGSVIKTIRPGRHDVDLDYIKKDSNRWQVHNFWNEAFQVRLVRSVAHYDDELLRRIFRQNHLNALVIQLFTIAMLMVLGWLLDLPVFRIPAAASILFLLSIATALIGALTYWFSRWRVTVLILFLLFINYTTSFDIAHHKNKAYGLDYKVTPADYSYERLQQICFTDQVDRDKAGTERILQRWKKKVSPSETDTKPKMVILSVSGGGLRSATWTTKVIQEADSLLGGRLLDHTVLVTGASGGMFGAAYMRELYYRRQQGQAVNLYNQEHIDMISQDMLNSIAFTLVANDIFLPRMRFEEGGQRYHKDRGYAFERQFNENTGGILDKSLSAYREAEANAEIPMLFISPAIVNDARRLMISPQGISYMMIAPVGLEKHDAVEIDAVDFGLVFRKQQADSLRFTSALRMNATYPYILPNVHLPSTPEIEVMDAGFRDNYGLLSATRFIQVFRDWIQKNTSGVVLLQVTSSRKIEEIRPSDKKGVITSLFNPLEIPGQLLSLQEFEQDNSLGFIYDLLGEEQFDLVRFLYHPGKHDKLKASISFHLTDREKQVVLEAMQEEENQESLQRLLELLGPSESDLLSTNQLHEK